MNGLTAALSAFTLWGFFPLYFKLLAHFSPFEILIHRLFWGGGFALLLIALLGKWKELIEALKTRNARGILILSGLLLSGNWLFFILTIHQNVVLEASLGYFICPILTVLLGVLFCNEHLQRSQALAIGLAGVGVSYLTFQYGKLPWLGLGLAFTFAFYSLARKRAQLDSLIGLAVETLSVSPVAIVYGIYLHSTHQAQFLSSVSNTALLIVVGVITATSLLLYVYGARKLKLSTMGILQYTTPSFHFILAVFLYQEPFNQTDAITFGFIWMAVGLYCFSLLKGVHKRNRNPAIKAAPYPQ